MILWAKKCSSQSCYGHYSKSCIPHVYPSCHTRDKCTSLSSSPVGRAWEQGYSKNILGTNYTELCRLVEGPYCRVANHSCLIGASLSEPHTSEFFIYVVCTPDVCSDCNLMQPCFACVWHVVSDKNGTAYNVM